MGYTGTNIKDLDTSKPDGSTEYANILDDAERETKTVLKNQFAIATVTGDTTLDATYSIVIANKATAIAITLPTASTVASSTFTKEYRVKNIGAGTCTITGTVTLNGTATVNPTLAQWDEIYIWTDGTTYYGMTFSSSAVANTVAVRGTDGSIAGQSSPAFSVNKNGTDQINIALNTATKVIFQTEVFDTNSNFAASTFTPTVSGKYLLTACVGMGATGATKITTSIYKNGSLDRFVVTPAIAGVYAGGLISYVVSANGSTDYFEVYITTDGTSGTGTASGLASATYFTGCRVGT